MYLIDTSIWIDYLREEDNEAVQAFINILDQNIPYGISDVIYQEILQGAASTHDFQKLAEYFSSQRFFHPKDDKLTYQAAAELYFNCRRKGITIRSSIDCLIAQLAIEHKLVLLHNDKDFEAISRIVPKLSLARR